MEIESTRYNHGTVPTIVMTCTVKHEVEFNAEDIVKVLSNCCSDDMAKIINEIGRIFNNDETAQCYSADDLNEDGKDFIEKMNYFLNNE